MMRFEKGGTGKGKEEGEGDKEGDGRGKGEGEGKEKSTGNNKTEGEGSAPFDTAGFRAAIDAQKKDLPKQKKICNMNIENEYS